MARSVPQRPLLTGTVLSASKRSTDYAGREIEPRDSEPMPDDYAADGQEGRIGQCPQTVIATPPRPESPLSPAIPLRLTAAPSGDEVHGLVDAPSIPTAAEAPEPSFAFPKARAQSSRKNAPWRTQGTYDWMPPVPNTPPIPPTAPPAADATGSVQGKCGQDPSKGKEY